ncbi:c-type cytochrome [Photobacterium indicum]|jgi:cytochrome c553|uniref:Cytochrome C n=1 Tax=Photobacterium indicum TaxID=81447 RepID=A0A2T3LCK6_9GAMM|nr:cytochrome c [Photobacterium indicum]PSV49088.1 cytochrome C [Photobacterium indicum]
MKNIKALNYIVICTSIALSSTAFASGNASASITADTNAGKMKAYTCQFCHGSNGIAANPAYPNINGQNEQYLYQSMKAYQNGERTNTMGKMMKQQLSSLQNQDLADIAAYYSTMD